MKGKGQYDTLPGNERCVFSRNTGSMEIDVARWRAVVRVLRSPVDVIFSTVYPTSCFFCGTPQPHLSHAPICDSCWAEIPAGSVSGCARCGDFIESTSNRTHCQACSMAEPAFAKAVFYGLYRGRMREAIHALKYERLTPAARRLGEMLAEAIAELHGEAPAQMLVVPVPLHRRRAAARGFNQTRLLARHAIRALRRTHPDWKLALAPRMLLRTRNTESQAGLSPRERRANLRGAFRVSVPEAVSGKHILLVDDILTTGATARTASLALRQAGAETVWVATLARARRDANQFDANNFDANEFHPQEVEPRTGEQAEPTRTASMFLSSTSSTT
jgi:ComF family protein